MITPPPIATRPCAAYGGNRGGQIRNPVSHWKAWPWFWRAAGFMGLAVVVGFLIPSGHRGDGAGPAPAEAEAAGDDGRVFFVRDVMPLVSRLGCNGMQCHGAFAGKGGMTLSLFAGSPEDDYETFVKAERAKRVNRMEPAKSLLLLKATGSIEHGGGKRLDVDSPEYKTILTWIERGAGYDDATAPKLVSVALNPTEPVLTKGATQAFSLTAVYSDGQKRDVTRTASFRSSDPKIVAIDASGKASAVDFGMCAVIGQYARQSTAARVVVPQPLEGEFPAVAPNNKIDELVLANLKKLGMPPAEICSDDVFLRRVFLNTIGTLPTSDEARAFLSDKSPTKRKELIDRLLQRDEFAAFAALKWGDILRIKAEDPVSLWPKAAEAYYQWVYESLAQNKPFDQFARELLTSSGSDFRSGPSNFFRAVTSRDPRTFGESAALVFMGARLSCARCHAHPEENWTLEDDLGMGAFFAQVRFKLTSEWKEEVVCRDPKRILRHPRTGQTIQPKPLGGKPMALKPDADPRAEFANWLTAADNPWFAKNIVNRLWYWLMGRGIIHEPDDVRSTNLPENPALLDYLAKELVEHHYDLKHIYRLILNSKTYQMSSVPHPKSAKGGNHFAHYSARRLTAEQIIDALVQVTGVKRGEFGNFERPTLAPITSIPEDTKAISVSDGSADCPTAALFGRPARATGFENERALDIDRDHVAFLANSPQLTNAIANSPRIQKLIKANASDAEIVDELFLAALSRLPRESERTKMVDHLVKKKSSRATGVQDVMWAVLNANGFVLNQ